MSLLGVLLRRHRRDEPHGEILEGGDRSLGSHVLLAGRLVAEAVKVLFGIHHHKAHELLRLVESRSEAQHQLRLDGLHGRIPCQKLFEHRFEFEPSFRVHVDQVSPSEIWSSYRAFAKARAGEWKRHAEPVIASIMADAAAREAEARATVDAAIAKLAGAPE